MKILIFKIVLIMLFLNSAFPRKKQFLRLCFDELVEKAKVENVTERSISFVEKDGNATTIKRRLYITWDAYVPEGLKLDGFIVKLSLPYLRESEAFDPINVCNIGNDYYWATTNRSSCSNYTMMCVGQNTSNLSPDQRVCPYNFTSHGGGINCRGIHYFLQDEAHIAIPANIRELVYDVPYRETYHFKIHPYFREFVSTPQPKQNQLTIDAKLDCTYDLQKDTELTYVEATEHCCEADIPQTIVQNVTISDPAVDFLRDSVNVTTTWRPPVNQFNLSHFVVYVVSYDLQWKEKFDKPQSSDYTTHKLEGGQTRASASCHNTTVYYEAVLYNLHPNVTYDLQITTMYHDPQEVEYDCGAGFCNSHTSFTIPVMNPCDEKFHICVAAANCTAEDPTGVSTLNSSCTCQQGYGGNGLNEAQAGSQATGCFDMNYCLDDLSPCAPSAVCLDHPAPSFGANCSCPDGYFGDGYKNSTGCSHNSIVALSVSVPTILILGVLFVIIGWKMHKRRIELSDMKWSQFVANDAFRNYTANLEIGGDGDQICLPTFGEKWEIDRDLVHVEDVLGRGNYGVVYQGTYDVELNDDGGCVQIPVAVKMIKEGSEENKHVADFLAEIGFMLNVGNHPNVLKVIGCCTTQKPVLLITDLLKYGDLLHFLWEAREPSICLIDPTYHITEKSLYQMARQVAEGMDYLTRSRIIHGDLAARNILVGEELVCKISDFGLANDVYRYAREAKLRKKVFKEFKNKLKGLVLNVLKSHFVNLEFDTGTYLDRYHECPDQKFRVKNVPKSRYGVIQGQSERCVPFKWISPERMMAGEVPITCKSDVWSFGNLLFEMVTLGCMPHADESSEDLLEKLRSGYRMKQPSTCSNEMYSIMSKCWAWRPSSRPSFSAITKLINRQLHSVKDKDYINLAAKVEELDRREYEQDINQQKEETRLSGSEDDVIHMSSLLKENEKSNGHVNHTFAAPV